ncbi:MAG: hypothetical protein ACO24H_05260 [Polynucleobacter sp.]
MSQFITTKELFGDLQGNKVEINATFNLNGFIKFKSNFPKEQLATKFEGAINRASQRVAVDLKRALDDALRSNAWGGVNPQDNDIYDSGRLLESGSVNVTANGIIVAYTAPYARLIHYGGYFKPYGNQSAKVYLPPRPWVDAVLKGGGPVPQFNLIKYYQEEIAAAFR